MQELRQLRTYQRRPPHLTTRPPRPTHRRHVLQREEGVRGGAARRVHADAEGGRPRGLTRELGVGLVHIKVLRLMEHEQCVHSALSSCLRGIMQVLLTDADFLRTQNKKINTEQVSY